MTKILIAIAFLAVFLITCQQSKVATTRARTLKITEATDFHNPLLMSVGWIPYTEDRLIRTDDNQYTFQKSDSVEREHKLPAILVRYPFSNDTVWIDMTMSDEQLGRLIKLSLMTEKPIKHPISDYMKVTKCSSCHPSEIKID